MFNPYPNNATDITTEWLNAALHESGSPSAGTITKCDAKLLNAEGNTGWYALAEIESAHDSGLPDSLFFKVATKYELSTTSQYENYSTEIAFYRDIASKSPGQFLQFIYGKADKETDQGIVVIEAFDPELTLNTFKGVPVPEALFVLRSMGLLQGTWWNKELPQSFVDHTPERLLKLLGSFVDKIRPSWPDKRDALATALPASAVRSITQVIDSPNAFFQQFVDSPMTVIQVDSRAENAAILDRKGSNQAVIFDWQRATLGPAFIDPAYFIGTSVSEADHANYSVLFDEYLSAVSDTSAELPSREQAEHMLALGSVLTLVLRLGISIQYGLVDSWIDSNFAIEDGNWHIQTVVRSANFVDVINGDSALASS